MCGISAIVLKKEINNPYDLIKNNLRIIAHRGPDYSNYEVYENIILGHRRLSIIDLNESANQPMTYQDKYHIVFNGEIYNYLEIREILRKDGYLFNTKSDTEVILAAYDKWGKNCVNKFNGMWSFVIYDIRSKILFCSRDRFGVKPFYYLINDKLFAVGSEIKQLLTFCPKIANINIIINYLVTSIEEYNNQTFFKYINKLEAGNNLIYDLKTNNIYLEKYYELNIDQNVKKLKNDEIYYNFSDLLENSIKIRLRSDVKVGTCLSGGLDSSIISSIAAKMYSSNNNSKFNAITAKSEEEKYDESKYAQIVVNTCDLEWNLIKPNTEQFIQNIDEVIYTQEEPFGSPSIFMQYFVFKKAKEIGCKVMLDGQGGDEIFLGYERYYSVLIRNRNIMNTLKTFRNIKNNSRLDYKKILFYSLYFNNYFVRNKFIKNKNKYLKKEYWKYYNEKLIKKSCNSYKNILELQKYEINNIQLPHLLKYEDKNSMRHSIETRLPMLDYRLVEFALSLENKYKLNDGWTKYILRKCNENILTKEIIWRKNKLGFNSPEDIWMIFIENNINKLINESNIIKQFININKLNIFNCDNKLKWRIFNLIKWEHIYNVEI